MEGYLEDHGGFFCRRCGRGECGRDDVPCTPPTLSPDVTWAVLYQTVEDSLPLPWEGFHYNEPTRRRALEGLKRYLEDRPRAWRIQNGSRL